MTAATKTISKTKKTVRRTNRQKGGLTKTALVTWFSQWSDVRSQKKALDSREKELKDRLMEAVEKYGYEDDKGHVYLDLPEEIAGVTKLQRQRRVSQNLDQEKAEKLLKKHGLWEDCTRVVRVIDEEALAAAQFKGDLSEEEFDFWQNAVTDHGIDALKVTALQKYRHS